ncbi:MAG: GWxTD domain-containing protein [Bacteroidales bacterium]|jgi:GWxTD domain-containing protein|nr:GWxTD domain-containing protein [Bacteroidales bacterium]
MKKFIIILGIISLFLFSNTAEAKRLQAYMSYSTFYSPADGPYIETYMIVLGNSIKYKLNEHNKYQGTIEVTLIFRQDSVIKNFKKINLLSPEVEDTSIINFNFIDQQRFLLPAGTYDVEITIADINDNAIPYKANETIEIEFNPDKISISGIELVESFKKSEAENILTKNGYDIMPYIIYYYPEKIEKLTYYAEVYNTDKILGDNEKLLLSTYIEVNENNQLYGDFIKVKRETAKNVIVVMSEFDISQLPTGNFNLVIEVRDKDNQQKAIRKLYFERDNTKVAFEIKNVEKVVTEHTFVQMYTNKDTLASYIQCLYPISSENEQQYARNLMSQKDINLMQKYFLTFWEARDPKNPGEAWAKYYLEVQKVNNEYSTKIKKGYETDRGRVYLAYGQPNTISKNYFEPSAYPYEIWHYYALKNQKNKKFVFYNPDLVTNDFTLIHSDAIGEINDYKWQQKIYGRNNVTNDIDNDGVRNHWGRKSDEYFKNPY